MGGILPFPLCGSFLHWTWWVGRGRNKGGTIGTLVGDKPPASRAASPAHLLPWPLEPDPWATRRWWRASLSDRRHQGKARAGVADPPPPRDLQPPPVARCPALWGVGTGQSIHSWPSLPSGVQIVEAGWWLHKGYNIISTFMYVKSILLAYFFALWELSFEGDLYTYKF